MTIDQERLNAYVGKALTDAGTLIEAPLKLVGQRLGLWSAMSGAGPITSGELAARTGTVERFVREWLSAETAAGYLEYDPASGRFTLPDEVAALFADPDDPMHFGVLFRDSFSALWDELDRLTDAFRTGKGFAWGDHDRSFLEAQAAFCRPFYRTFLTDAWVGALEGIPERLEAGGRVADVGCGWGVSTIEIARAYPNATVTGFDVHDGSIAEARKAAAGAGVADRVSFEVADAVSFPGAGYDLVTIIECLHDMTQPLAAARRAREAVAKDGAVLVVDIAVTGRLEDDLANPYTRMGYAVSTQVCLPSALSEPGGAGLGTMAGIERITQVLLDAGFSRVRRIAEDTPLAAVYEARP